MIISMMYHNPEYHSWEDNHMRSQASPDVVWHDMIWRCYPGYWVGGGCEVKPSNQCGGVNRNLTPPPTLLHLHPTSQCCGASLHPSLHFNDTWLTISQSE